MLASLLLGLVGFLAMGEGDEGFISLLADDPQAVFDRIKLVDDSVSFVDGEIRLTGSPRGYLVTKASYGDFRLRFDWKFDLPEGGNADAIDSNSGVLLRIKLPHKVWPSCLECQLTPDDPAGLFAIDATYEGETNGDAQRRAVRPAGRWNEVEIEMRGRIVVSRLNGVEIGRGTFQGDPGPIGFQSQGGAVRFRNVRIKPIATR